VAESTTQAHDGVIETGLGESHVEKKAPKLACATKSDPFSGAVQEENRRIAPIFSDF
jgi:hypothetical protein